MSEPQTTSHLSQSSPELTTGERLVRAILDHRVIEFAYQGYRRTVEPYLLGLHEAGEPILLGYQTAGASQSGEIPGWRTFITTAIGDVEVTSTSFAGPRSDFNPFGHSMLEIFARA
jgi:WYL domain